MNIGKEIATLKRMTVTELRKKHLDAFSEPTGSPQPKTKAGRC